MWINATDYYMYLYLTFYFYILLDGSVSEEKVYKLYFYQQRQFFTHVCTAFKVKNCILHKKKSIAMLTVII